MIVGRWLHWAFRLRASLLSAVLCLLVVGSARGHGIPILVDVSPEGKLVVTSGEDIGGIRVIFDNAQKFNATTGFTSAPGWDIVPAVQNSTIKLRVLSNLIFWNTADGIGGTTPASLTGRRIFGATDQFSANQSGILDAESIIWDADALAAGTHHVVRYEVPASAPAGAYGLLFQLEDVTPPPAGLQALAASLPSDPVLFVFNQGLGTTAGPSGEPSEYRQGVDAIAAAAVPEPTSIAAFFLGAMVLGAGLWRSRRGM